MIRLSALNAIIIVSYIIVEWWIGEETYGVLLFGELKLLWYRDTTELFNCIRRSLCESLLFDDVDIATVSIYWRIFAWSRFDFIWHLPIRVWIFSFVKNGSMIDDSTIYICILYSMLLYNRLLYNRLYEPNIYEKLYYYVWTNSYAIIFI